MLIHVYFYPYVSGKNKKRYFKFIFLLKAFQE